MPRLLNDVIGRFESVFYGAILVLAAATEWGDGIDDDPLASAIALPDGSAWSRNRPKALNRAN